MLRKGLHLIIVGIYTLPTLTASFTSAVVSAQQPDSEPLFEYSAINHPVIGRRGMVASHNQLSVEIAAEILAKLAMPSTLVLRWASLWRSRCLVLATSAAGVSLVHVAALDRTIAIDFRETAPAAASQDMFFDANGNVVLDQTYRFSHKSSAVPGSVAGLAHIVENYGSMTLAEVLGPAIKLAKDGIEVTYDLAADLARSQRLKNNPASLRKFYKPDGSNYEVGERWKQPD